MKKSKKTALTVLSPRNISSANFAQDVAEYKQVLDELAELKGEREAIFRKMKTFMRKYLADKPIEGTELATLIEKIGVYRKIERPTFSKLVTDTANEVGYHFEAIASKPKVIAKIKRAFGEKFADFITEVAESYSSRNDKEELDEEATKQARNEFEQLCTRYDDLEAEIKTHEIKANQVKEYVSLYKDLASIASVAPKARGTR